jgi:N-carbamoyl-L-amino-acid hydrolase
MRNIQINSARLWESLMEMAQIGATDKGGVRRLALTELDRQSRDLFIAWCEQAGCQISIDEIGNIFARRQGLNPDRAPVLTGSHLDSQPSGGKFDGAYGVLAGLEIIRTLNDADVQTDAPIEICVWTNEEGSRFAPAMMGSGAFTGILDLKAIRETTDLEGNTVAAELERIGYCGDIPAGGRPVGAYFEAHIEQGPILEAQQKTIGVVTGGQGIRWYDIRLTGQDAHAGPTPMNSRRDALLAASQLTVEINAIGLRHEPNGRSTVGTSIVSPNSRNVIPGQVDLGVDIRHPEETALEAMAKAIENTCQEIQRNSGVEIEINEIWAYPPQAFASDCIEAVRRAAESCGYSHQDIVSGAGHDAIYMSSIAPTAMVFIPCEGGISHNEIENITQADAEAGCNVLLHAMLERAE